jgi:hypothetical protein
LERGDLKVSTISSPKRFKSEFSHYYRLPELLIYRYLDATKLAVHYMYISLNKCCHQDLKADNVIIRWIDTGHPTN